MDAQATVTVGPVARGGLVLPAWDELVVSGVTSTVTSACVGGRCAPWWETVRERLAPLTPRVRHGDNGPEHHRRRTPCKQRLVCLAGETSLYAVGVGISHGGYEDEPQCDSHRSPSPRSKHYRSLQSIRTGGHCMTTFSRSRPPQPINKTGRSPGR